MSTCSDGVNDYCYCTSYNHLADYSLHFCRHAYHCDMSSSSDEDSAFIVDTPTIPIYGQPQRGYSVNQLFNITLDMSASQCKVCTDEPVGVRSFASYKVDLSKVSLSDLTADDNGIWKVSIPRRRYQVTSVNGEIIETQELAGTEKGDDNTFTVVRQYGVHGGTSEFRRVITTITNNSGVRAKYAVMQYFFTGGKQLDVTLPKHGNASSKTPHNQTAKSVRTAIQASASTKSASQLYVDLFEEAEGVEAGQSISQQPRNRKQIYNAKYLTQMEEGHHDQLYALFALLEREISGPNGFLREVLLSPLPSAIAFFDVQLECKLSHCCESSTIPDAILGVDATFNLGDFYVTITTFKHPKLLRRSSQSNPVFFGPIFIHMKRRFQDYFYFFSTLLKYALQMSYLNAYGTDGEQALLKALEKCFPFAVGLRCSIHKRRNIEHYLHENLHVPQAVRKQILDDIFGKSNASSYICGIGDAESPEDFDAQLEAIRDPWERLAPGFHHWFVKHHATDFKIGVISSVRRQAGVNAPSEKYTTNANESLNKVVKFWQNFTKKNWPDFLEKLKGLVKAQVTEAQKALFGGGEYELSPTYQHLMIDSARWSRMSPALRLKALVDAGLATPSMQEIEGESSSSTQLSTSLVDSGILSIPSSTLKSIEEKAAKLMSDKDAIVPAPGVPNAFMVKSSGGSKPHFVTIDKGAVKCDSECGQWRGSRICAHSTAVAEAQGLLANLVTKYRQSKRECNITNVIIPPKQKRAAGTKSGQPGRSKKGKDKSGIHQISSLGTTRTSGIPLGTPLGPSRISGNPCTSDTSGPSGNPCTSGTPRTSGTPLATSGTPLATSSISGNPCTSGTQLGISRIPLGTSGTSSTPLGTSGTQLATSSTPLGTSGTPRTSGTPLATSGTPLGTSSISAIQAPPALNSASPGFLLAPPALNSAPPAFLAIQAPPALHSASPGFHLTLQAFLSAPLALNLASPGFHSAPLALNLAPPAFLQSKHLQHSTRHLRDSSWHLRHSTRHLQHFWQSKHLRHSIRHRRDSSRHLRHSTRHLQHFCNPSTSGTQLGISGIPLGTSGTQLGTSSISGNPSTSGTPLGISGIPLNTSGIPLGTSSTQLGISGIPLGTSGTQLGTSSIFGNPSTSGTPLGISGIPLNTSGIPLGTSSTQLGISGIPLGTSGTQLGTSSISGNPCTSGTPLSISGNPLRTSGIPLGISGSPLSTTPTKFWLQEYTKRIKKCASCGGALASSSCSGIVVAATDTFSLTFSSGHSTTKQTIIHMWNMSTDTCMASGIRKFIVTF